MSPQHRKGNALLNKKRGINPDFVFQEPDSIEVFSMFTADNVNKEYLDEYEQKNFSHDPSKSAMSGTEASLMPSWEGS